MITFEEIELRGPELKDIEVLHQNISEAEVNPVLANAYYPLSYMGVEDFLKRKVENSKEGVGFFFSIYVQGEGPLGVAEIRKIDWKSRHAEFGIWIAKSFQGKGFEKKAAIGMLHFAFTELGLHRVYSKASEGDAVLLDLYEKELSFSPEGIEREHVFHDGKFHNIILFGMLEKEFLERAAGFEVKIKAQKGKFIPPPRKEFQDGSKEPVFF